VAEVVDFRVRLPTELRPREERPREYVARYDAVLDLEDRRDLGLAALLEDMEQAAVDHAIVHAEYELGDPADELNEAVASLVADDPRRFSGYGTVSLEPLSVMRAVHQVAAVADLGLQGVNLQPSFFGLPIDHPQLYPVYAKACELGLGVGLHTGINYSSHRPIKNDHPLQLDQVACDFEGLTLIACHAGWPWAAEMVAVARKHPTVYLEFGGLAPKYVGARGTGWEPVFRFMNSLLSEQVLFGTDWPVFPMDRALSEWRELGLKPAVLEGLLGGNARRLLGTAHQQSPPPQRGDTSATPAD
jgi:predicted TIM-barrel fold metal-dependent hydrolase